jgi:putative hydrolase of the HAD superfamily
MSEKTIPNYEEIKVIAFDADDTLFVNETYFRETENKFVELMVQYETPNNINHELIKLETSRLPLYGYGIKGFILTLVECAIKISNNTVSAHTIQKILEFGQDMLNKPIELLEGVEETLKTLSEQDKYRLIVITKGDLLDQERKLDRSGLSKYFHHIEVVSEKAPANYMKLLKQLDCPVEHFLMVGNSLKSDVLPLLEIGAKAIHVPFHTTWVHETVHEDATKDKEFHTLSTVREILPLLT